MRLLKFFFITTLFLSGTLLCAASWTHTTIGSAPTSTRPVICSDPLGNLHVAWTSDDPYGELVQYASNQSGSWSFQKKVAGSSGHQCYNASITADQLGNAYIVYRYEVGEIRFVHNYQNTSNYWSLVRQMSSGHFHEPLIEVDKQFGTHVFAQEDSWGSNIFYQKLDPTNNIALPNVTQFFSTTADQNDNIHLLGYNDGTGLYHTVFNGTSWSTPDTIEQIDATMTYGLPSITCDINNVLHIASSGSGGIYYLNNLSGTWSTPELVTDGGIFPNVVADENSKAHIVFYTQVDNGGLFYTNNVDGGWITPEYVTTINTDASSATEDVAHVESKIALDPKSNTVNIIYCYNSTDVILAQTSDFNLRSAKSTDTNSSLISLATTSPILDKVSTSASGALEMLHFTIDDNGGDGLATKMKELIIQRGPGMTDNICFNDIFSKVTLTGTDGTNLDGAIYSSKVFFGSLDYTWKEIPENTSYEFTVNATLKQALQNVDGKSVQMKINGLYDIITDPSGSQFAYNSTNVLSDTVLFQVMPDHFEFVNLGDDFFGKNLVEGWWMQLKIVDANGVVATSIDGINVTLSAVQLDGITPTTTALQSTDALTKTFANGIATFTNITYPDTGQFRILANCDVLTAASDTITIFPHYKTLLIAQPDENITDVLDRLTIEYDFYKASNYAFPSPTDLLSYQTIILDAPYSVASYFDSTSIKSFLESGTAENPTAILAAGDNGLGYYANSKFANVCFGGMIQNYFQHSVTTVQGVSGDPITDELTLNINDGYTNIITPNSNLANSSVILTFPQTENIVGVKTAADNYRTVFMSVNFADLTDNAQRDSLISKINQWFQSSTIPQTYGPELSDLPDINMTEDFSYKMAIKDWFSYVEDADTPDDGLLWNIGNGSHSETTISDDTLIVETDINFYGKDTLTVIVSDGQLTDTGSVIINVAPVNDPPEAFALLTPDDDAVILDTILIHFTWETATDVESRSINYILQFEASAFDTTIDNSNSTELYLDASLFPTGTDISWTVLANDYEDTTTAENAPFTFQVQAVLDISEIVDLPDKFVLYPSYPNPFNPITTINYDIPKESHVTLTIFNINGQVVDNLVDQKQESGFYSVHWDARHISAGIYFYQVKAGGFKQIKKMLLIK